MAPQWMGYAQQETESEYVLHELNADDVALVLILTRVFSVFSMLRPDKLLLSYLIGSRWRAGQQQSFLLTPIRWAENILGQKDISCLSVSANAYHRSS